jgi:tRNA nucleotidyltransferase (CCA-adding enzyme)
MNYGFKELKPILESFSNHGHNAYLVGGSSRDILLSKKTHDVDIATDAKPEKVIAIFNLKKVDPFTFKFGNVKTIINEIEVDITTLRQESSYTDLRHPEKIEFIKDPQTDSLRRDFTINAIYMDKDGVILDFHNGQQDLKDKVIRMIGDPVARLKEDPVRILRALRFALTLNMTIEDSLLSSIKTHQDLLNQVSDFRIKDEITKMLKGKSKENVVEYLKNNLEPNNKVIQILI